MGYPAWLWSDTRNTQWHEINCTGENLDAVRAVTESFKMADTFAGGRTGGAIARTSAQTIGISVDRKIFGNMLTQRSFYA